jgi:GDPmannose 4,6-dehydratase
MADPSKAQQKLAWQPRVSFEGLVRMMVEHDLAMITGTPRRAVA